MIRKDAGDNAIRDGMEQDEARKTQLRMGRDPSAPDDSQDVIVSIKRPVAAITRTADGGSIARPSLF